MLLMQLFTKSPSKEGNGGRELRSMHQFSVSGRRQANAHVIVVSMAGLSFLSKRMRIAEHRASFSLFESRIACHVSHFKAAADAIEDTDVTPLASCGYLWVRGHAKVCLKRFVFSMLVARQKKATMMQLLLKRV